MAEMLDSVEAGESVEIERLGVRFQVVPAAPAKPAKKKAPILEILDEAIERGDCTWRYAPKGLTFTRRTSR